MAYPVVTHGLLCWPFNWCFVVFLSSVVFMSTCITVNYYVDCVSIHTGPYQSIFPLPHLLERTSDCSRGRTHLPTYTHGRTHPHIRIQWYIYANLNAGAQHVHMRTHVCIQAHKRTCSDEQMFVDAAVLAGRVFACSVNNQNCQRRCSYKAPDASSAVVASMMYYKRSYH